MTKQEYYDLLVEHTNNGNFPARSKDGVCRYRVNQTKGGKRRCAIGLLIPDDKYSRFMEDKTFDYLVHTGLFDEEWIPEGMSKEELSTIQGRHDNLANSGWDVETFITNIDKVFNGVPAS